MSAGFREPAREADGTLGALLYRDASKPRIPEGEWVELVRRVGVGDTRAMGTLYMWTHGIVFAVVMRISKDRPRAEDVTVEVHQELWSGASGFDGTRCSVVAWIMNVARARAMRACGASKR